MEPTPLPPGSAIPTPPAPPIHQKITRGHSCILCQQRKVRCDRQKPQCSNCVKAHAECIPSTPAAPRRRRRKLSELDVAARLRKYEHLLRVNGIRIEDDGVTGGVGSANASGTEDGNADESISSRQEKTLNPNPQNLPMTNKGKDPATPTPTTTTATRTENNDNQNGPHKHRCKHDFHEHGHHRSMGCGRGSKAGRGQLYSKHGNSRYIENTVWENLSNELQDPKEAFQVSSEEDDSNDNPLFPEESTILLGNLISPKRNLRSLHPQPVTIFRLWQIFLTNVNPLIKLFHAPTVQEMILEATSDMDHIPKPTEALMFVIYLLSIGSLKEDECESTFNEPRSLLLSRYSHATQQALINVKYIKSLNLTSLQAYCLFLLAARKHYDAHAFWILTGSAVRIGQRLGIHRDGSSHSLSPFDTEMRRRVWWQIVFLDGFAAKLCGAGFPAWLAKFDTKLPLNVSDSDLTPDMIEPPPERAGATEMLFCCIRYEVSQAIRKANSFGNGGRGHGHGGGGRGGHRGGGHHGGGHHGGGHHGGGHHGGGPSDTPPGFNVIAEKDKTIDELEARLQDKYLQYCDPSIPLHLLSIYVAKSVICTMRLMAHHPRQYPDKGASMPQKERDMLFNESLKMLEYDGLGHSEKLVQRYLWHIHVHFQLDAFIYLLSELRRRERGELVDKAWQQVELAYEFRAEMLNDTKSSLYFALGNLVLKAWEKREEGSRSPDQVTPPRFISILRSQRQKHDQVQRSIEQHDDISDPFRTVNHWQMPATAESYVRQKPPDYIPPPQPSQPGPSMHMPMQMPQEQPWLASDSFLDTSMPDITPMDWEYWQTLLDGDLPAYTGQPGNNYDQNW
ncbi:putative fungal specific transcription factor domain-containing protein [Botrytis cinerea BcDW1]|uniref:Putative fungal specific transcription factor domain-containing protein n=1 Tax=Botryotinia fuckeliana (strain BcDW1) TaxID=1290391 RepID=M7TQ74_BOTF1|nr:putative fungal specific transcription factor domain-containing protein [Botrytis cinerea BcDW1]